MTERDVDYWRGYARQCAIGCGLRGDDVEDAAQDALIALIAAWDRPQGDPEGYYIRVTQNATRQYARRERTPTRDCERLDDHADLIAPNPYEAADRAVDAGRELRDVAESLDSLSPRQRDVMRLTLEGLTPTEIAEALGTSAASVHWSTWDARQRLSRDPRAA